LEFFGCEWSKSQIREIAEMLFNEYYWLHVAELKHLIMQMKMGEAKVLDGDRVVIFKVYGKLKPPDLTACFSFYANESLKERQYEAERKAGDERYNERWGSHDARLKTDSEAYTMNGLITHEKAKLNNNGKVEG
jgi:hypothetical protein